MPVRNSRLYIFAPVAQIKLAFTSVNGGKAVPCMDISYPMDYLESISLLLSHMKETRQVPTVHIWDGENDRSEIAVIFDGLNPSNETKRKMMPHTGGHALYDRIITIGEADIDAGAATAFIEAVAAWQFMMLIVTEEGSPDKDLVPLFECSIKVINHFEPVSIE